MSLPFVLPAVSWVSEMGSLLVAILVRETVSQRGDDDDNNNV